MRQTKRPSRTKLVCGEDRSCPLCPLLERNGRGIERLALARHYPKWTMLFWQGEPVKQVFILCAGLVRLFFHTPEGEELTWKHTRPGQIMGYTGARGDQSLTLSAQVVDDSLVRVIALADFRRWLHAESEFRDRIDQIVAEELHQVHLQLRELGCKVSTEKRVARLLLRLTSGQSNERMIRATVEQLGQMVGLKHRAMTKHLGEFNREREISSRVV